MRKIQGKRPRIIENGKGSFVLFFMWLRLVQWTILVLRKIGRFVLFSRKNNQERWMESKAYLESRKTSTM